jgi:hypothetical protein
MQIPEVARRVAFGIAMVVVIAVILLFPDRHQRKSTDVTTTREAGRICKFGVAHLAPEEGADLCLRGLQVQLL